MKNQKSLSSVSDEHLVDMLDASILSYNVYVLENTKVKQHQLLEGFREEGIMEKTFALYEEKIKEINKMPSSIEQEGLLLAETRSFLIKLRENEKYKKYFDSIATNLMDNYDATYRGEEKSLDLNKITGQLVEKKTKIWDLAKSDASILIDREVCLFLMKKYRMRKDSTFFKYLEKSTDGKGELVYKNTLEVEKDYESAFKINEQKIMLVAKDRMQDMIPVTSYHIGRHNPSYVKSNLGEWNHLYTDEKGKYIEEYDIIFHLFGEQRMPSLLGILQFQTKKHVFINSKQYPADIMKPFLNGSDFSELPVEPFDPDNPVIVPLLEVFLAEFVT